MKTDATGIKPGSTVPLICMAFLMLAVSYFFGIWVGLWNTYGDAVPSWGRVHFALLLTALPFILPLILNIASIPMLKTQQYKPTGIMLLVCSIVLATLVGVFIVPMGNF